MATIIGKPVYLVTHFIKQGKEYHFAGIIGIYAKKEDAKSSINSRDKCFDGYAYFSKDKRDRYQIDTWYVS